MQQELGGQAPEQKFIPICEYGHTLGSGGAPKATRGISPFSVSPAQGRLTRRKRVQMRALSSISDSRENEAERG